MTDERRPGGDSSRIGRLVEVCCAHARWVVLLGLTLGACSLMLAINRFAMNTDTNALIDRSLPWRVRESAFNRLFHPEGDQVVVVVDGATPELAESAAAKITAGLAGRPDLFAYVMRPDGGAYFAREGLLFASADQVRSRMAALVSAQPFLGPLAADPSLRGLMSVLSTAAQGAGSGQGSLAELRSPISRLAASLEATMAGRPTPFSWEALIGGENASAGLRRLVLASPRLDYQRLRSGGEATEFIGRLIARQDLDPAHGVTVRLTGAAPLADQQLSSLAHGAGLIAVLALAAILFMLWMAVRSAKLIAAILVTMLIGLAAAMALGLVLFGRFNVISVAFIPLFVGLGIDFGIQFTVRFLACRNDTDDDAQALAAAGAGMGHSLALAASAIAVGFFSFAPTRYVGVSQLGVIAGAGMFIALGLNLTVLPALIALIQPAIRARLRPGRFLEQLDGFILGRRRQVLGIAAAAALVSAGLIAFLHFDFNPLHLQNPRSVPVATLRALMRDPDVSPDTIEIIAPDLASADALARRLARLPQVAETRTVSSFVPPEQAEKLAAIGDASQLLDLSLDPLIVADPPTDADVVAALRRTAADLRAAAGTSGANTAAGDEALRLAGDLERLARSPAPVRARASETLIAPFQVLLGQTREALAAEPATLASLPPQIRNDWLAADGRARVSVAPKGDADDNAVMRRFISAVRQTVPDATGTAVDTFEGGRTVAGAFAEAGLLSFLAITALLFAVLRRARDVVITMTPILLTGLLTLASCVVLRQPLNFANIIALPLLFGVGVAFHIYFVLAWRLGAAHLLQSSLTRAVFFSALATATGFGSLWASSHPGTASMGELLMISLVWTLVSALLFQPALMGPPRPARRGDGVKADGVAG